jgi:hypothetical protein
MKNKKDKPDNQARGQLIQDLKRAGVPNDVAPKLVKAGMTREEIGLEVEKFQRGEEIE